MRTCSVILAALTVWLTTTAATGQMTRPADDGRQRHIEGGSQWLTAPPSRASQGK